MRGGCQNHDGRAQHQSFEGPRDAAKRKQLPARVRELAALLKPELLNHTALEDQLAYATTLAPKLTIQGGTTEILRGIIARGLGLR